MVALSQRLNELHGFYVRLHLSPTTRGNAYIDGVCRGVEDNCAVLDPAATGARVLVPLGQLAVATQLPPRAVEGG